MCADMEAMQLDAEILHKAQKLIVGLWRGKHTTFPRKNKYATERKLNTVHWSSDWK